VITIKEAEEILKKEYHIDNFTYMVDELILPDFKADKHEVVFNNSIFASVNQLGYSVKCDVTVYEVLLNDGAQNRRVAITQEMFRILRGQGINNAIVAFSNADYKNYRLSLLTSKYEFEGDKIVNKEIDVAGGKYTVTCLSMGNPHCVIFTDNLENINLKEIGPKFENDPIFPERVNTEFAKIIDSNVIMMRVWERGSGETMECGTGACAVTVAAVENGYCKKGEKIRIKLPKGEVTTCYAEDGTVYLTGDAIKIYDGVIEL
jgi:diaminopimelate epimerase